MHSNEDAVRTHLYALNSSQVSFVYMCLDLQAADQNWVNSLLGLRIKHQEYKEACMLMHILALVLWAEAHFCALNELVVSFNAIPALFNVL